MNRPQTLVAVFVALLLGASCRRAPRNLGDAAVRGTAAETEAILAGDPAQLDQQGILGDTALHLAAEAGNAAAIEVLVAHHASLEIRGPHGRTALHLAAAGGHDDCVRLLLAAGASWKVEDADGRTPLLSAVGAHHREAADALRDAARAPAAKIPTRFLGVAVRLPPSALVFDADRAHRAPEAAPVWGDERAPRHGTILRFGSAKPLALHDHAGDLHVFVTGGSLYLIGVTTLEGIPLAPGSFVYLPPHTPHTFRCDVPPCSVYEEDFASIVPDVAPYVRAPPNLDPGKVVADPAWNDDECFGRLEALPPSTLGKDHVHPFEFLVVVSSGTMRYSIGGDPAVTLGPGAVAVFPAGVRHAMECDATAGCLRYLVQCGER